MKKSIHIIDDEFDLRENIKEILSECGYNVISSSDAQEAISQLNNFIPDMIISDIMMPGITGLELLNYIKNIKKIPSIPFIFLSAKSSYNDLRNGMVNGADDYIFKPFKAAELIQAVESKFKKHEELNSQLDEIRESIALSVPHEFRTPLTPIIGLSSLMIDDSSEFTHDEIKDMCGDIKKSALRLHSRIEKFILFSNLQIELNEIKDRKSLLNNTTTEIAKIIGNIARQISITYGRNKDIELNLDEGFLKIDEFYFSICIKELIENACKFSNPFTKIKITGIASAAWYNISFINKGKGLTSSQINKIKILNKQFDPAKEGSGLGLPIVKKIIKYFGGKLTINSEPDIFTDISIQIPAV